MNLLVWHHLLVRAAQQWSDRADELYGARATLQETETSLLGPRVGPAAEEFATRWAGRLGTLYEQAQAHAEALSATAADFTRADEETVERLQRLLPWDDRDASPGSGG